jgi:hypothetical protein
MDERYFNSLSDQAWHTLRILNYPPVAKKLLERQGQARAGAHSGAIAVWIESVKSLTEYRGRLRFLDFRLPRRCEFCGLFWVIA